MKGQRIRIILFLFVFSGTMCRKTYEPPAVRASNHFLAIDGIVNTGANSTSSFKLSRSLNLLDSMTDLPELKAQVSVISSNGSVYQLNDTGGNAIYISAALNLDPALKYQVSVITTDGNKYMSDPVASKSAPAIDSLTWQNKRDPITGTDAVKIFINTHDATNKTRYYRWDYTETYQHNSFYQSFWFRVGTVVAPIPINDSTISTYQCWSTGPSTSIILGTSIALGSDVISQAPIAQFSQNDPKLDIKYSILVRQYPLDPEAYTYWLNVQNNSQSLGGLYDLQPSQINGNFHSVTNPRDPALGYVSASSVSEIRLFIDNHDLPRWKSNPGVNCPIKTIPTDPLNTLVWNYADTSFDVYYFVSGGLNIAPKHCLDCKYQGGTTKRPDFWE